MRHIGGILGFILAAGSCVVSASPFVPQYKFSGDMVFRISEWSDFTERMWTVMKIKSLILSNMERMEDGELPNVRVSTVVDDFVGRFPFSKTSFTEFGMEKTRITWDLNFMRLYGECESLLPGEYGQPTSQVHTHEDMPGKYKNNESKWSIGVTKNLWWKWW